MCSFCLSGFEQALRLSFVLVSLALGFTLYLVYLQAMVIQAFCDYCLLSALLVTLIFVASSLVKASPRSTGNLDHEKVLAGVNAAAIACRFQSWPNTRLVTEFAVPGASAQQPQMTAAPDGTLYLVYGAGRTIYCVVSSDGGKSFGLPAALEAGGMLMLGRHRGPRVAATKDAVTITAIAGKRGGGQDGDLLAWRSTDHGKTWGQPDGSE